VSAPPVLDSERLVMRAHVKGDFAESAALWGDPEVVRFIGGVPLTEEEVWVRLLRHVGHWALIGYGVWVVRERASDRFVGEVGLMDLHRAIEPRLDAPEMGWVIAPWAHGRGYATEAVGAALAWSDRALGPRTCCLIEDGHAASVRVAAKHGYRERARTTYKDTPAIVLERDA
jgi:RimJ/RimL family protein N-acetyltransferase